MIRWITALLICFTCVAAQAADMITLTNGETLEGTVESRADGMVMFKHPLLGELKIPEKNIASIKPVEEKKAAPPQTAPGEQVTPPAKPKPAPAPAPKIEAPKKFVLLPGWDSHVEAGFSGAEGNTRNLNLYFRFATKRESPDDRTNGFARVFYATQSGDTTQNNATAGITQDWFINQSKWFAFADGTFDYDQFQSWEYRVSGHGGLGYQILKDDKFNLSARGGIGAVKEFHTNDNAVRPEALIGVDFAWNITKNQAFTFSNYFYPDLLHTGEFRNVSTAAYQIKLDTENNLSLKFGVDNEYQSDVAPDKKKDDLKYFGALVVDF